MFEGQNSNTGFVYKDLKTVLPFEIGQYPISDVKMGRDTLNRFAEYQKQRFTEGYKARELVHYASEVIDDFLSRYFWHFFKDYKEHLALIAVGGYGRREQFPYSDIDLLIVSAKEITDTNLKNNIESFISVLWDLKLKVGSSVRSVNQAVLFSRDDQTIITNLLETHFICGNETIYRELKDRLHNDEFWNDERFYRVKREEQENRYHSFRDTMFSLEPDIKNNPGALRDLQMMKWLAIKIFNLEPPDNLETIGLLSKSEYSSYLECENFLFTIRYAEHCISSKDILRLDNQKAVASLLGYGNEGNAPVENMMRDLYKTFHTVKELNNIIMQEVEQHIYNHVGEEFSEPVFINNSFVQRGAYIDIIDQELFNTDPTKILDLFLTIAVHKNIDKIHFNCLRALHEGLERVKKIPLITNKECRTAFKRILTDRENADKTLNLMHMTRVLSNYMPQWARIEGLAQFDRFHLFSVDEHSIRVVQNIFRLSKSKDPCYQLYRSVFKKITSMNVLITASLLHDIGKGRGGNHALKGAKEAEIFCRLHNFDGYETKMITWLIESHLSFNTTATRRDISDLSVIDSFRKFVKDEEHLNQLYCLTVADISATNENAWNSWKDNIFRELYHAVRLSLSENLTDLETSLKLKSSENLFVISQKAEKYCKKNDIARYLREFPLEYFIHYQSDDIVWHMRNILRFKDKNRPLILFSQTPNIGTEALIFTSQSSPSFFGNLMNSMALKQLNVFSAQIFLTHNFHLLCTIMFQNKKGLPLDTERLNGLRKTLLESLKTETEEQFVFKTERKIFDIKTKISFLESGSSKKTRLEISTLDSPGLLAKIGKIFGNLGFMIEAARITTTGARADDYFSITDINGLPLSEEQQAVLIKELTLALDSGN